MLIERLLGKKKKEVIHDEHLRIMPIDNRTSEEIFKEIKSINVDKDGNIEPSK